MTDETPTPSPSPTAPVTEDPAGLYIQVWQESMAQVLGQIAGAGFGVESLSAAEAEKHASQETDLHVTVTVAGALRGEMALRFPRATVLAAAQFFLGEPQDSATEFKPTHQEALEELLRQVAGHAATALKPRWGEVQLRVESGAAPSWSAGASGWLASGSGAAFPLGVEWRMSAALHAALVAAGQSSRQQAAEPPSQPVSGQGNLDLLMDVELEVTLRFGECNLPLRDILELGEGSVVELDRQVEEPVDLLLDGKLIARGQVVVVDGNYGLRIEEMLTRLAQA